jgi:hypothetical protein
MIPAEWRSPVALGELIDQAYPIAERYLGHRSADALRFRRLVAESLFAKLRRDCHQADHAQA